MSRGGVIVLAGLPGAGKSTLARALASRLPDARVLDKDVIRDALFGPCDYTATESQVSVSAMLDAARYHLGSGRTVIFDGMTFSRRQYLGAVAGLAAEMEEPDGDYLTLDTTAPLHECVSLALAYVETNKR